MSSNAFWREAAGASSNATSDLLSGDVVIRCEYDATRAASAKAYLAAVTSLGAGLEALLLLRCLGSPHKARKIAEGLARGRRRRFPIDLTKWTFNQLIDVCLGAGWLPPVESELATYSPADLANILRLMRNYVHPGRQVRERPWVEVDERDYKDADAIYLILLSAFGRVSPTRSAV
jgi:hypothetical protein